MTTTAVKSLKIDRRIRPDRNTPIDELFRELILDAHWAKGLVDFASDLYDENNTGKVDTSAVFAFVEAVRMPMENVVDAILYIEFELKQREAERGA
jgi:hypothetical protein